MKQTITPEILLGEYIGELNGICAWDIPEQLREKLERRAKELQELQIEMEIDEFRIKRFGNNGIAFPSTTIMNIGTKENPSAFFVGGENSNLDIGGTPLKLPKDYVVINDEFILDKELMRVNESPTVAFERIMRSVEILHSMPQPKPEHLTTFNVDDLKQGSEDIFDITTMD